MTTIINTPNNPTSPSSENDSNSGVNLFLSIILLIVMVALFFIFLLPAIENRPVTANDNVDVNIKLPANEVVNLEAVN